MKYKEIRKEKRLGKKCRVYTETLFLFIADQINKVDARAGSRLGGRIKIKNTLIILSNKHE